MEKTTADSDLENAMQERPAKISLWRKLGRALILLLVLLGALYTLGGFVLLPRLAKDALEKQVQQTLGRELKVHAIDFNPFSFFMRLNGVELQEADGTLLLSLRSLSADLLLRDLIEGKITLNEVSLQAPWVHLRIDQNGTLNLMRLIADAAAGTNEQQSSTGAEQAHSQFLIKRFQIGNGTVRLTDLSGTTPREAYVVPVNLTLNEISNRPGVKSPVNMTATTSGGGSLRWKADLSLQPFSSHGGMQISGLKALTLWEFLQDRLNIDPPHGSIDLEARYSFSQLDSGPSLVVDALELKLSALLLRLKGAADPLLSLQTVALTDGRFELDGNRLTIGQLRVADGAVNVSRKKRVIDWSELVRKREDNSRQNDLQEARSPGPDWRAELQQLNVENIALAFGDGDLGRPVATSIGSAALTLSARAEQAAGRLSAQIDGFGLKLREIAMRQTGMPEPLLVLNEAQLHRGRMDLASRSIAIDKVEFKGGRTRVVREKSGRIDWQSMFNGTADSQNSEPAVQQPDKPWQVEVASVLLDKFDVALNDHTNAAAELHLSPVALKLTGVSSALEKPIGVDLAVAVKEGGNLAVKGRFTAAKPEAELDIDVTALSLLPLRPYLQPVAAIKLDSGNLSTRGRLKYGGDRKDALSYNGAVQIEELRISEPKTGETLLGWKLLDASELALSLKPDGLQIREILLTEPAGKFVINKDLSSNWQHLSKEEPEQVTADAAQIVQSPFPVSVDRIQVDAGKLDFADFSLPLEFSTRIHELSGAVVGISTAPGAKASSDLKGRVDEFGSAVIKGDIAPLDPLLFTDMRVVFSNLSMANLTPYTAKFAGYLIDSGKLSLDLHYRIEGKKLLGENQVVLNKLKLGKKVKSPDAIDAPLELAIALMQDSRGIIDLGLPIKGDMNDPEFSYGHLVFKAIGNLFTKIVTAPFRILGAILGVKGDDLDSVAFEPGSALLAPPEQEKLKAVAKALSERPKLALQIQGQYDEKADGEALRELALRREIGERLGRKPAPGKRPDPISLTDHKTRAAVEELFAERISATELAKLKTPPKSQPETGGNKPGAGSGVAGKDAGEQQTGLPTPDFYENLYRRLVTAQPLAAAALENLARERGQAIVQGLTTAGKLPDARIRLLATASVTSPDADKIISKMNLGVGN